MRKTCFCILIALISIDIQAQTIAKGVVYEDANGNGKKERKEKGIPGVAVSNGVDVVLTGSKGEYQLNAGNDRIIFVIKPSGYVMKPDSNLQSSFYYNHKPAGSPVGYKYGAVKPTGPIPGMINFGLMKSAENDDFTALIFGDPQPYTKQELDYFTRGIVDSLSSVKNVVFGISLGDIVGDNLDLHKPYLETMRKIGIPWYNVMGNHDINYEAREDSLSDESFEAHFGPANYSFNYGKVHSIIMDDILYPDPRDGSGYLGGFRKEQLDFVENDLKHVSKDQLVIVSFHIPLMQYNDSYRVTDRQRLFDLLSSFPHVLILSAHTHLQRNDFYTKADGWNGAKPLHEYNAATTSGDWYSGELDEKGIPYSTMRDGTPKGFAYIHFKGNEYVIDYKVAGKPSTYQIDIFTPKVIPQPQRNYRIYANYFMGSKNDVLEYQIDGGEWKKMNFTEDPSPAYTDLLHRWDFATSLMPGRRPSNPAKSTHVWFADLPGNLAIGEHAVEVKVKDMFGRNVTQHKKFQVAAPVQ